MLQKTTTILLHAETPAKHEGIVHFSLPRAKEVGGATAFHATRLRDSASAEVGGHNLPIALLVLQRREPPLFAQTICDRAHPCQHNPRLAWDHLRDLLTARYLPRFLFGKAAS